MDLQPVQLEGNGLEGRGEGQQRQKRGIQEAQKQKISDLSLAGRGDKPVEYRVYQVKSDQRVKHPKMEVGVSMDR